MTGAPLRLLLADDHAAVPTDPRERGSHLDVGSAPGRGTRPRATVPTTRPAPVTAR
ncbi:hypothetical protein [Streptomyces sp. NPDC020951]|uniref:hypothetical protein n=1 Tax=Streptomyces sp. NPDC020951 TaxID=3365104 RepID=UPI003799FB14